MNASFIYRTDALLLVLLLCTLMLLAVFFGLRFGKARLAKYQHPEENPGNNTVIASLFGLLGFLLAFTFGMSGSRYDSRRQDIVAEANAIGTALLRSDLYPDSLRLLFRKDFKAYTESRIRYYEAGRDETAVAAAQRQADILGTRLWKLACDQAKSSGNLVQSDQMIPALNDMLDSATKRNIGEKARVPDSIVLMLFILSVASAFYVGYAAAAKGKLDWFVVTGFCLLTSIVVYITLDLDRPRRGMIKTDSSHQAMLDLRQL